MKLNVKIPANTTATVYVPAKSGKDVTEGGRAASESSGINSFATNPAMQSSKPALGNTCSSQRAGRKFWIWCLGQRRNEIWVLYSDCIAGKITV